MAWLFGKGNDDHDSTVGLDRRTKRRLKREQKERDAKLFVRDNQLRDKVPRDGYEFHSNYYTLGNKYFRILTLIPPAQADRTLTPFWRLKLYPYPWILNDANREGNEDGVFGVKGQFFDMVENKTRKWFDEKLGDTDKRLGGEFDAAEGMKQHKKMSIKARDMKFIADDFFKNDMYASTDFKCLLSADSLRDLDIATERYNQYIEKSFEEIRFSVYEGQQRDDYTNLMKTADVQIGHHPMATSSEYAGGYAILNQGIIDPNGDYIGQMVQDINVTAVLMDMDNFDERVVVGSASTPMMLGADSSEFDYGTRSTTLVGVRIAQSALVNNHRVIHLVLNDSKPQNIGADLSDITTVVSMNDGAINPFEIFGDIKDEISLFPAHSQKIRTMIKQISPSIKDVDLNETFVNIFERFYKDEHMLVDNPEVNRDKLRLAGLPHDQYPLLDKFIAYLNQAYDSASRHGDSLELKSIRNVRSAFTSMYKENSAIFNSYTDDSVDNSNKSMQVVYDFSGLKRNRGMGIAMAQLINVIRYATSSLTAGDVVIVHGCNNIAESTKSYLKDVFSDLSLNKVRLVYLYDQVESMIDDIDFNKFDEADYTMVGMMTPNLVKKYIKAYGREMPRTLKGSINDLNENSYKDVYYYLSRKLDNILFALDMQLGTRHGDLLSENPQGRLSGVSSIDSGGDR